MDKVLNLLWLWGIGDSLWLAMNPTAWAGFWRTWLTRIERSALLSSAAAAVQLGMCLYLLVRGKGNAR